MSNSAAGPGHNSGSNTLLSFVERIERLTEQKKAIADDIKDVKKEAANYGFAVKAIERIVKERAETPEQKQARREIDELTDVYRAALGMLDGTPLGEAARKRLARPRPPEDEDTAENAAEQAPAPVSTITPEDIAKARDAGKQAAAAGKRVIDNPFTAGDPRRAAWDEGWCSESGSDGMEIPAAWRRSQAKKGKKPDDEKKGL